MSATSSRETIIPTTEMRASWPAGDDMGRTAGSHLLIVSIKAACVVCFSVRGEKLGNLDFIQRNYHPYDGDESFLAGPTQNTKDLWAQVLDLQKKLIFPVFFINS